MEITAGLATSTAKLAVACGVAWGGTVRQGTGIDRAQAQNYAGDYPQHVRAEWEKDN